MGTTPPLPFVTDLKRHGVTLLAPASDPMFEPGRLAEISSVAGGPAHDPGDPDSQVQHAERFES